MATQLNKILPGREKRFELLNTAAARLMEAADTCKLGGKRRRIQVDSLSGPRVGALYVRANIGDADALFTALSKKDCAAARQIFPWKFDHIAVYWEGHRLRVEASWEPQLAVTDIRLADIALRPNNKPNVFFPGVSEFGDVITLTIDDACAHLLCGGGSGMGKSVSFQNLVLQASSHQENRLILIDAKQGEGLGPVAHVQGQIAPIATTHAEITAALSWIFQEMKKRYNHQPSDFRDRKRYSDSLTPVYIFLDEVQEVAMQDGNLAEIIRKLAAESRAVKIRLFLSTQKPVMAVFGSNITKSNIPGRLALRTVNYKDSELVVGGKFPRADHLQPWEAWCISPAERFRRAQLFNVTEKELLAAPTGKPEMDDWPVIAMSDAMGQLAGPAKLNIEPKQGVISIFGAKCGIGQGKLQKALDQAGVPERNSTKARGIRDWGREALKSMKECGYSLCKTDQWSD